MTPELILFAGSGIVLLVFLVLKFWEVSTGNVVAANTRGKMDAYVVEKLEQGSKEVPRFIQRSRNRSKSAAVHILHYAALFVLTGIRFLDKYLVEAVHFIRGRHNITHRPEKVSPFLKDLSEEQRKGK